MSDPTALGSPRQPPQQQITTQRQIRTSVQYEGILPPPEMLAQFNDVIPNGAERLMAMAESQLTHRQTLEANVVNGNVTAQRRGQLFAFTLGVLAIVGGMTLIAFNKPVSGLVSIITAFVALASVFFYSRAEQAKERETRRQEAREAAQQPRLSGLDE